MITKENQAKALVALYNASHAQGMGLFHFTPKPMSEEEAARLCAENTQTLHGGRVRCYFDYLNGRVMKIDLAIDGTPDPRLYDRDCGQGAAARALASVGIILPESKG